MPEELKINRPSQAPETGTPATPGGGPEPDSPTRRTNEPGVGPAAGVVRKAKDDGKSTEQAMSEHEGRGVNTAGNVTPVGEAFSDAPQAHRQEVEEGGTTADPTAIRRTEAGPEDSLTVGERAALRASREGSEPVPGDLQRESPYEERRDAGRGGEEEDPHERVLREQPQAKGGQ